MIDIVFSSYYYFQPMDRCGREVKTYISKCCIFCFLLVKRQWIFLP